MERETKEITTSGGHKIVLATYITGAESRVMDQPIYSHTGQSDSITGEDLKQVQDNQIKLVVKSVNGKTDKVLDDTLNLPLADFMELVEHLNEITGKKKAQPGPKQS